jgi:DUF1707 SHOCT-like domain
MDDRIRISDADRERVTARLREHFAEGRLTPEELEERISAALSAKTFGELRHTMADLPDPAAAPAPGLARQYPQAWPGRPGGVFRRGPRLLPLAVFALVAALVIPGAGWLVLAFFQLVLALWLVAFVAGIFAVARFRRNMRRHWQSGGGAYWRQYQWHG